MANITVINTHEATFETGDAVDRKHYTVAQLIAELQMCNPEKEVVIKNLNTGKYGSLNFQGVSR